MKCTERVMFGEPHVIWWGVSVGMTLEEWLDISWKGERGVGGNITKGLECHTKKYCPYLIHQLILNLNGYQNYLGEHCGHTNPKPLPHTNYV